MQREARAWIKTTAFIALASLSCVLFTALTPPVLASATASRFPLAGGLPFDQAAYWIRFALAFLLLGLAPAILAIALGETPSSLGLSFRSPILRKPVFWLAVPAATVIGALGALSPEIGAFYPYAPGLAARVRAEGVLPFLGHFAAYLGFYYLPWEFFFRGFLLLPFVAAAEGATAALRRGSLPAPEGDTAPRTASSSNATAPSSAAALIAACALFQTIPSAMLHIGHPLSELASAVMAGIAFGILAWKTRSIFPGLILHAAIGLGTDAFIVFRAAGYL